jgi:tRNA threonylcarbamoyladenosine biosynthesis protein TsaE
MSTLFVSTSPSQTEAFGAGLGRLLRRGDVVLLTGDLGAGKTQFTKGVARALGVARAITSPTFNLMVEYRIGGDGAGDEAGAGGEVGDVAGARSGGEFPVEDNPSAEGGVLRHFDLYRLEHEHELDDIDYFGLLEDDAISVVEWGDRFPGALPLDYLLVAFALRGETMRELRFEASGPRSTHLLEYMRADALVGAEDVRATIALADDGDAHAGAALANAKDTGADTKDAENAGGAPHAR